MAKFRQQPDPEAQRAAFAREEARRARNRAVGSDPVVVCVRCGWKIYESERQRLGVTRCMRCGGAECKVHALDYDLSVRAEPRPSLQQIEAEERQMRSLMGRR